MRTRSSVLVIVTRTEENEREREEGENKSAINKYPMGSILLLHEVIGKCFQRGKQQNEEKGLTKYQKKRRERGREREGERE